MAQLTPEEIIALSEPIEQVYASTVDALLIKIAEHFNSGHKLICVGAAKTFRTRSAKQRVLGNYHKANGTSTGDNIYCA